ncbi:porphobilinogen synthase [Rarobacter faecitabidus]|uniref:Delta-aminolevulinic acid dehydratase n=1 Tax=Rarobacter faecitabidus TaxID=13243 RepID=A0A542ZE43_RARFA|nr:porphobilinogen synthase [Rarobacter faecitabidus]TQL58614.1 porphobilinogen synthase [Rarobacter faecitabidus]
MPHLRPRRARRTPAIRELLTQTRLHPRDLVLPVFVKEGLQEPAEIRSMPGVYQHTIASVRDLTEQARDAGLGGIMVFAVPQSRDALGSGATDPDGFFAAAIRAVAQAAEGALVVMSDICLDEFTDHGHCGVLRPDGTIDNDATIDRYAQMAVIHADAGADVVGLSGMMDGQTAEVRAALDDAGLIDTLILSYTAKYASAFYGPFRDAVESTLEGDRRTYQMDPANRREALRALDIEEASGADIVMVKPAGSYLDVLADLAAASSVPVAAYQVSGEYAMIEAASANGWIDRERVIVESLIAIRRAGADVILTYYALEAAAWLAGSRRDALPVNPPVASGSAGRVADAGAGSGRLDEFPAGPIPRADEVGR